MKRDTSRFFFWVLVAGSGTVCVSVLIACAIGPAPLSLHETGQALAYFFGVSRAEVSRTALVVVGEMRLPRALLALLCGSGLGMAGAVFQGLLHNPLAEPFTLGVSGGAAFGASLALTLGLPPFFLVAGVPVSALSLCALAGAMASLGAVLFLGRVSGGWRREALVLAGVVVSSFLSALISLVKSLNEESVAGIVFWLMGSFQGRGWEELGLFFPWWAVGSAFMLTNSKELDIMLLGDVQAGQLGVQVSRVRLILLTAASMMTGACVSVTGIIGFVGLIVPHLVRLLLGTAHRRLLPASALCGAMLLLWADILARIVLSGGAELPVGVITAMLGGPFFCLALARRGHMGS